MSLTSRIPLAVAVALATHAATAQYQITVLHNNDGESRLLQYSDGQPQYGGVARFATLLDTTRSFYEGQGHGVVSVYAGDTFLAGPQFQASLESGAPGSRTFYDALAISRMNYDVSVIGNHEFDFGPDVLAEFIGDAQTTNATTYLSANLNFAGEAALQAHVTNNIIRPSVLLDVPTSVGTKKIGIIGVTTDSLPFISSPRNVVVNNIAAAVNAQITQLQNDGADHIILAGHLQGIGSDNTLVSQLNAGIDLIIAGGGSEMLVNDPATPVLPGAPATVATTGLIPGDSATVLQAPLANAYPVYSSTTDAGGNTIPMVTTDGNYGYLGRVTLNFDGAGNLTGIDDSSNPQRVVSLTADPVNGVAPNAAIAADIAPVQTFVDGLASSLLATTSVQLLHGGSPTIRSRETNLGNFVADGILDTAQELASSFGVDTPVIGLVNGGGIRANVAVGNVSRLNTFSVSPFGNFVAVVEDVKAADLKLVLENAYSRTTENAGTPGVLDAVGGDGRFAQVAGMEVVYDITQPGFAFNSAGVVTTPGSRVRTIIVGGTTILQDGVWLVDPLTATFDIATLAFSANGGDQWFRTAIGGSATYLSQIYAFTALGTTDQQALQGYIEELAGGNVAFDISSINAEDYQIPGGSRFTGGRISIIPEPSTYAALLGAAVLLGALARRRRS